MLSTYFYTLKLALLSTLIAAAMGIPTAFFCARRDFPGRKLLLSASAIPLCVPALIVALGYVAFWGVKGFFNTFFGTSFSFLYTSTGIIIAQGFYNFPLVTGIVHDAWSQLPREQADAARLLGGAERRIFWTITIRQLSGAVAAACIPVFLFCFFSFMIVMLFSPPGASTVEVEIYHAIRNTFDTGLASRLAILETATAIGLVAIYGLVLKRNQVYSSGIAFSPKARRPLWKGQSLPHPFLERTSFIILILFTLLFFASPFFSVFINGATKLGEVLKSKGFWTAALNSLTTGLCTGFSCTVIAFAYSLAVKVNHRQGSVFFQTIPLLPMSISSVVISWCAMLLFHKGNFAILVMLQTLLYWPLAYRQIQNGINRIDEETDRAARLFSKGLWDSVFRVYIPACKKVIISAFAFSFALSLGDATMPLVLGIKNFNTLALYAYKLAGAYRFGQACTVGGIVALLSMLIFGGTKIGKQ